MTKVKMYIVYDTRHNGVCVAFGETLNEVARMFGCKIQDVKNMVYMGSLYKNRYTCEIVTFYDEFV